MLTDKKKKCMIAGYADTTEETLDIVVTNRWQTITKS